MPTRAGPGLFLEELTWPEAKALFDAGAVVVVPIGAAAKEHGPHLPLGTDWRVARALAEKAGGHADEHETSLMLAIDPAAVRLDRAEPDYGHALDAPKNVFHRPVTFTADPAAGADYSRTGAFGDPTLATAEKGRAFLDAR